MEYLNFDFLQKSGTYSNFNSRFFFLTAGLFQILAELGTNGHVNKLVTAATKKIWVNVAIKFKALSALICIYVFKVMNRKRKFMCILVYVYALLSSTTTKCDIASQIT